MNPQQQLHFYSHKDYLAARRTVTETYPPPPLMDGMGTNGDLYYNPFCYLSDVDYNVNPGDDVIIIMINGDTDWYGHGLLHTVTFKDNTFQMPEQITPNRLCLWLKNVSDKTTLHVPQYTRLVTLLCQPEILYRVGHINFSDLDEAYRFKQQQQPPEQQQQQQNVNHRFVNDEEYDDDDDDDVDDDAQMIRIIR